MKKIIVGLLLALLSGLLVVSAPPASAAGGCTIYVPRYVYVDAPYERIEGRLGANCASSGMNWSAWDITHVYYGLENLYFFETADATSDTWDFYDYDHLGTYRIEGSGAYDLAGNELTQNTLTTYVRLRSHTSLAGSRSGNYVTLTGHTTRYNTYYDRFGAWAYRPVDIQYRYCATCVWHHLSSRTTGPHGGLSYRFYAPRVKDFRAVTASTGGTWGATSPTIRR